MSFNSTPTLKGKIQTNTDQVQEAAAPSPFARTALALSDIKVAHSVFALPFALLAAFLAAPRAAIPGAPILWSRFAGQLALVVVCMVLARTWAMLVNRLADHRLDAHNPRTLHRAIASGRIAPRDALLVAAACAIAFQGVCLLFWPLFANPWPAILAIPVLAWIALYSFTKRFTALCHLFLGGALAASPIAASIAIDPTAVFTLHPPPSTITVYLLAGFVLLWVAGFDVAYALQDLDFDVRTGLHSIPATLGWRPALYVARTMHALALLLLIAANLPDPRLGPLFAAATIGVGVMLTYEHYVIHRRGAAGIPLAFFTLNGLVSLSLGLLGILDTIS